MEREQIFVNVDPGQNYSLTLFNTLRDEGYLSEPHVHTSRLAAIQSNAPNDNHRFRFGGNGGTPKARASAFGKTASAVFRMVMLHAVGVTPSLWPKIGKRSEKRNKNVLQTQNNAATFNLIQEFNNQEEAVERYNAAFDRVFPHYLIRNEVLHNQNHVVRFKNEMVIFRRDPNNPNYFNNNRCNKIIKITTEARAKMFSGNLPQDHRNGWESREFYCKVEVTCECFDLIRRPPQNDAPPRINLRGLLAQFEALAMQEPDNNEEIPEKHLVLQQLGIN